MTQEHNSNGNAGQGEQGKETARVITIALDKLEDVDHVVRDAISRSRDGATSMGESIRETINAVRATRDSVVMVRVSTDSLAMLDELVESGLTKSRSESAALMIAEGIKARADLFDKIAEQTQVIRAAREQLKKMLEEDSDALTKDD